MIAAPGVHGQRGAAAVEFALVSSLFFVSLLGAVEVARILWVWNAGVEATRLGARLSVVCPLTVEQQGIIVQHMRTRVNDLSSDKISFDYIDNGLGVEAVRVSINGFEHQTVIPPLLPRVPTSLTMPSFSTTLRREWTSSVNNPVCAAP